MRLDVCVLGAENFFGPIDRQLLACYRIRSRHNSVLPVAFDNLFVITEPIASSTASETKFSEGISSMPVAWPLHLVPNDFGNFRIDFPERAAHSFQFARFVGHRSIILTNAPHWRERPALFPGTNIACKSSFQYPVRHGRPAHPRSNGSR